MNWIEKFGLVLFIASTTALHTYNGPSSLLWTLILTVSIVGMWLFLIGGNDHDQDCN